VFYEGTFFGRGEFPQESKNPITKLCSDQPDIQQNANSFFYNKTTKTFTSPEFIYMDADCVLNKWTCYRNYLAWVDWYSS